MPISKPFSVQLVSTYSKKSKELWARAYAWNIYHSWLLNFTLFNMPFFVTYSTCFHNKGRVLFINNKLAFRVMYYPEIFIMASPKCVCSHKHCCINDRAIKRPGKLVIYLATSPKTTRRRQNIKCYFDFDGNGKVPSESVHIFAVGIVCSWPICTLFVSVSCIRWWLPRLLCMKIVELYWYEHLWKKNWWPLVVKF